MLDIPNVVSMRVESLLIMFNFVIEYTIYIVDINSYCT